MRTLYLISGDLAAGKSTLANNLSNKINVPCLIKDEMKEICCDIIGFSNREENKKNSSAVVSMMIYVFNQLAKQSKDIILEANFRKNEIDDIINIATKNNYVIYKIMLIGDPKILYQRFLKRLTTRHKAHKTLHLDESYEKYLKVLLDFRSYCDSSWHVIDVSDCDEKNLLEKVYNFISNK